MEKYKKPYKNNKFQISAPTWNKKFKLPDVSSLVSDTQDYFESILKKQKRITDDPSIRIYINKIENRITFKINSGYYLELLTLETMKLLGSSKSKTTKDVTGEKVPRLEITEVVLILCNIVNNDYQQDSRVLHTFVPNKSFGQSLDISPESFIFLKTFNSEFSYIEVWFTDQSSKPREIEDKINVTLVIN